MEALRNFPVSPGWRLVLVDLGLSIARVLRRAGLPEDLFARTGAALTSEEFFGLWRAVDAEADDPELPLRIAEAISVEAFDPPVFAALCSPNLEVAMRRIAHYKRLMMPMAIHVERTSTGLVVGVEWLDKSVSPPRVLIGIELVFFVQLARIATRHRISPRRVHAPELPTAPDALESYFGVPVRRGARVEIEFTLADAELPFLTADAAMWDRFEPELRRRLAELDATTTSTDQVRAALLELLPSGATTIGDVAKRLHMAPRTLQRRLKNEGSSFVTVLHATRHELARHYLRDDGITSAEISFLLGFADPNSFFRAFHEWSGETPERVRRRMREEAGA